MHESDAAQESPVCRNGEHTKCIGQFSYPHQRACHCPCHAFTNTRHGRKLTITADDLIKLMRKYRG